MKKDLYKGEMKKHLIAVFILFIFAFTALIVRVVYINIRDNQNYKTSVLSQHVSTLTKSDVIAAKRGSILDRNSTVLAESVKVYNVIYDPGVLNQNKKEIIDATNLTLSSTIPGITIAQLNELLVKNKNSHYQIIARELDYNAVKGIDESIKDKSIQGVFLEAHYKRIYPYNTMASDVIGFFSNTSGGSYGVEEYYQSDLCGKDGRLFGALDDGAIVNQEEVPPKNGNQIVLTIDFGIQKYVEEAILKYYEEHDAKSVNVIVMNPKNGEILAMASHPNYNLNDPYNLTDIVDASVLSSMTDENKYEQRYQLWRNFMVSDTYEPGSTYKPFVIAAALEEGKISLNSTYQCDGGKKIHGHYIRCWKEGGHGVQTVSEALANSCNVALMEIGEALGKDDYFSYQQMFGFGAKTNIDVLGEGKGVYNTYEQIGPVELATGSFGQGFNVTPIQLTAAFSSLINGGYLYEPYLMKEVIDEDGKTIMHKQPQLIRQTVSEDTSKNLIKSLETVVDDGTGNKASIEGYRIGGKTGTAEKGNRLDDLYMVSFIGFAPVENPQLITLVVIDEPDVINPDSGLASKVFTDIMTKVLPYKTIFSTLEID
ncbi:MAG: peptidoglycan glycosyltransferase [Firmicutes bacterium HGW-Firmicutes-1]|jgi:stage V sporulation protein D (sporulation-specific penicillin-binding protein)|nr:MAG: peptidoglycan glycosyltransferase [Firmicutes bacterium HGW-Firmicutes-1]